MERNPVGWFEIYVSDMGRAKEFYEYVLQVKLAKLEKLETPDNAISAMWAFPMKEDAAGAAGALMKMEGGPSGGGTSTIVYFTSEDCAVEVARVGRSGGSVMKDKFSIGPYGYIALLKDPDGNVIGLHSRK